MRKSLSEMESLVSEIWEAQSKNSSAMALQRWRDACAVVKNPKRRFRFTANLSERHMAAEMRRSNQEKLRVSIQVSQAAFDFITKNYGVPKKVNAAGFKICADELESIVEERDHKKLDFHGGVDGIIEKLATDSSGGISTTDKEALHRRQAIYGINKLDTNNGRTFLAFVREALNDESLVTPGICALVSLVAGTLTEGWPKGGHQGIGITAGILLVVFATAVRDYCHHLRDLDNENKVYIQVTRDGLLQKLPVNELLAGDIMHLVAGDEVPADGLFVSGFPVLTNENGPVMVSADNPFILSGARVEDGGACKMLVTAVGMRTRRGKLRTARGGCGTWPAGGFATIIGKLGLALGVVSGEVLIQRLIGWKWQAGSSLVWAGYDASELLEAIAMAGVPEGLPLAVTLSLVFAMKKMTNRNALLRRLSAAH